MPPRAIPFLKLLAHFACLTPAFYLFWIYRNGVLAANSDPVNYLTHFTGDWALWILLADLAITPIRRLLPALGFLIRLRRLIGLYVFFYATLHLATYVFLFSGYDVPTAFAGLRAGHLAEPWHQLVAIWPTMRDDVLKRRFIQVGLFSWLLLFLLTLTSPTPILRSLGGKTWAWIHRLVYFAAIAACVHYWWLVKPGDRRPWKDTAVLAILLLARLAYAGLKRMRQRRPPRVLEPV